MQQDSGRTRTATPISRLLPLLLAASTTLHAQQPAPSQPLPGPGQPEATQAPASQTPTAQAPLNYEKENSDKARAALDAMVQALGGDRWLNLKMRMRHGRTATFYHGNPTGGIVEYWDYRGYPSLTRTEYTKHRDVLQIFDGKTGWEVTYRGKRAWPKDQMDEYLRRERHSLETAVHDWLPRPGTLLLYEGTKMVERHLAEQVTLVSAENDSITIQTDHSTHLPLRVSYSWRDPLYKDMNEDATEFDDYHVIDGIPTPFTSSTFHNAEMTRQNFLFDVAYDRPLPADYFDADASAGKIKK